MTTKTIKISRPVEMHGKIINELVLKEPTGGNYLDLGEPHVIARSPDGSVYAVENEAVIKAYLDRCVEHEHGSVVLRLLGLADSKRVKAALLDFFTEANQAISAE
jgi:hypothetical protein